MTECRNIIEVNLPSTSTSSTRDEADVTCEVLATLDNSYQSEFNHTFTESVVKHCCKSEGIMGVWIEWPYKIDKIKK